MSHLTPPLRPGVLRTLGGCLAAIAAVPAACVIALLVLQLWILLTRPHLLELNDIAFFLTFATPIGAVGVLVFGLPAAILLQRRGHTAARTFVLCGATLGALPLVVYALAVAGYEVVGAVARRSDDPWRIVVSLLRSVDDALPWLTLFAWCGGCAAWAYWRVVIRTREGR